MFCPLHLDVQKEILGQQTNCETLISLQQMTDSSSYKRLWSGILHRVAGYAGIALSCVSRDVQM